MKPEQPAEIRGWSPRRLVTTSGVLFVFQVTLILWLGVAPAKQTPGAPDEINVHLLPSEMSAGSGLALTPDPTVFVLPGEHGFSGQAWLTAAGAEEQVAERAEEPAWLLPKLAQWGSVTGHDSRTGGQSLLASLDKLVAQAGPIELSLPSMSAARRSTVRLEGDLATWPLQGLPVLPLWPHAELLASSTVEILVDPRGDVFSTRLVQKSGLPTADRYALRTAALLRFRPVQGNSNIVTGQLHFLWSTSPPGVSNAVAGPF